MRDLIDRFTTDFSLLDRKTVFALTYTAAGLTAIYYLKNPDHVSTFFRGSRFQDVGGFIAHSPANNLPALGWWVSVVSVFYFVIPAICIRYIYGEKLSGYGLKFQIEPGFAKLLAA